MEDGGETSGSRTGAGDAAGGEARITLGNATGSDVGSDNGIGVDGRTVASAASGARGLASDTSNGRLNRESDLSASRRCCLCGRCGGSDLNSDGVERTGRCGRLARFRRNSPLSESQQYYE